MHTIPTETAGRVARRRPTGSETGLPASSAGWPPRTPAARDAVRLAGLPDYLLADIGLTRDDVRAVAAARSDGR